MKKTFKLNIQDKHPDQLLDNIKQEVRKYVKRERRKKLPSGSNFWAFDCKFGVTEDAATEVKLRDIIAKMDEVKAEGGESFYVEILAKPGVRKPREQAVALDDDDDLGE